MGKSAVALPPPSSGAATRNRTPESGHLVSTRSRRHTLWQRTRSRGYIVGMSTPDTTDLSLPYVFAPATAEDFDRLFELRIAAMRESLERIGRFDERRAFERFRSTFTPEHTRLVLIAGQLVGCVAMKPEGGDLLLEHFYLYPAFQGRGLGAAVLQHLLVEADKVGRPIRLSVLQRSDAGRFYRRFGFVETSQDDFDIYFTRLPSKPSRPEGE